MPSVLPQRRLRLLLLATLLAVAPLHATVLQELEFEDLVQQSQLVFLGTVLRSETETGDGLVHTRVWFSVEEVIAGDAPGDEFSLRFVGGDDGNRHVDVAGQYIPAAGLRGIWFVRDPLDHQVNPLTGWQQGAFPVQVQADGTQLLDLSGHPDLIMRNMRADPVGSKMLGAGYSEEQIAARLPDYARFPLQDFVDAIRAAAGVAP